MSDKMKTCPYCGEDIDVIECETGWYGVCDCGMSKGGYDSKEECIEALNTRIPMERIVEQLEKEFELVVTQFPLHGKYIKKSRAIAIVKGVQNE